MEQSAAVAVRCKADTAGVTRRQQSNEAAATKCMHGSSTRYIDERRNEKRSARAVTVISVWAGEGPALLRDQDKHRSALCCSGADARLWGTLSDRPTLPGQRRTHTVVTFNKEERKRNASHVRRENKT